MFAKIVLSKTLSRTKARRRSGTDEDVSTRLHAGRIDSIWREMI